MMVVSDQGLRTKDGPGTMDGPRTKNQALGTDEIITDKRDLL